MFRILDASNEYRSDATAAPSFNQIDRNRDRPITMVYIYTRERLSDNNTKNGCGPEKKVWVIQAAPGWFVPLRQARSYCLGSGVSQSLAPFLTVRE